MLRILKTISSVYDYASGRYKVFVTEGDEVQACFEVRKHVFGGELGRWESNERFCPALVDEFDDQSVQIGCLDTETGKVVAAVRLTPADRLMGTPEYRAEYQLDRFPNEHLAEVSVVSRFAILPEYRNTPVSLVMLQYVYEHLMDNGFVFSSIVCEPNLYPLYRRVGFRPLGAVHVSPFGGYRLSLFLLGHDFEYFKQCGSPYHRIATKRQWPVRHEGLNWFRSVSQTAGFIDPGFTVVRPDASLDLCSPLTEGLSEKGCAVLLKNAVTVDCQPGDQVLAQGAGGRTLGFVKTGALEVRKDDRTLAILGEGDIFGEIAFILDTPRTADVVAVTEDTEIVLISLSGIKHIKDPADQTKVWQNLARVLAERLSTS
jgi:N-acyl-L-homoserine lactone synthetase